MEIWQLCQDFNRKPFGIFRSFQSENVLRSVLLFGLVLDGTCLAGCRASCQLGSASDVPLCQHLFCSHHCWLSFRSNGINTGEMGFKNSIILGVFAPIWKYDVISDRCVVFMVWLIG